MDVASVESTYDDRSSLLINLALFTLHGELVVVIVVQNLVEVDALSFDNDPTHHPKRHPDPISRFSTIHPPDRLTVRPTDRDRQVG